MIDDEKFFAWLDGELGADEAALVEREVAADPRLSGLASAHRAMQAQLKGAFDQVVEASTPERLLGPLRAESADVVDFVAARDRPKRRMRRALPQWISMAAMLAIGVFAGTLLHVRDSAPVAVDHGRIYAASGLADALDMQLASAPASDGVRIGLTFRDGSGAICRTFGGPQGNGLACRKGGRWQVRGLFTAPEGQSNDYRMAAGMDPNLATLVESTMAGEPFDAAQEEANRRNKWR